MHTILPPFILDMAWLKESRSRSFLLNFLLITFFQFVASKSTGFTLKIYPWDSPKSPLYHPNMTQAQKIQMMAISSKARANQNYPSNNIRIPIRKQQLHYSVNIKIGEQRKEVSLLLDTGSGPIWTKCDKYSNNFFNPLQSKTYKTLPCDHPLCLRAGPMCKCIENKCVCTITYGASNKSQKIYAVLSSDSFSVPLKSNTSLVRNNMIFGCSVKSPIFSGILGMDKLPVSFISQVRDHVNGRFSYCLHGGDSFLRFGNDIPPVRKDVKTTPILYPNHPSMFLDLIDISVNGKRLGLSPSYFSYKQGGFMIDTGASLTILKTQAYARVILAIEKYYKGRRLKKVNGKTYNFDLCYMYNRSSLKSFATMTYHFRGADFVARNLNVMPKSNVMCIGLIPADEVSILGALQQWNTRFIFDINSNKLQFVNEDCSQDGK